MKAIRIGGVVLIGLAAAWGGYWTGHAFGWSENADWPWRIGGGGGAILLAAGTALAAVLAAIGFIVWHPFYRSRRLNRSGRHAEGLVLDVHDTGVTLHHHGATLHQSEMELEVHPRGARPFVVHTYDYLDDEEAAHLLAGSAVSLRFDPAHPKRVAIEHEVILN